MFVRFCPTFSRSASLSKVSPEPDQLSRNLDVLLSLESEVAQPGPGHLAEPEHQEQLVYVAHTVTLANIFTNEIFL